MVHDVVGFCDPAFVNVAHRYHRLQLAEWMEQNCKLSFGF